MAVRPLRQFGSPGVAANTATPEDDQLYITSDEMRQIYGMNVTEAQIRMAMSIINATVCRPSLWPEQYEERAEVPSDRNQIILTATPVIKLLTAAGRYAYGRRDRRALNQVNYDYLAAIAVFGSPPRFQEIDVNQIEFYGPTGELWLPTGFFLINYTQIQVKYLSGFNQIPDRVKAAMAEVINAICTKGYSDRKSYSVGRRSQSFETPGYVTQTAYMLLEPYILRSLF